MLQRVITVALAVGGFAGLFGCTDTSSTVESGGKVTLQLDNNGNGMQYCDASGACQDLPYSGDCTSLQINIDTSTAETCQTCILADGSTVDQGCSDTAVACVLVTLPEPDCVVCAYVNGAVLYSSCTTNPTNDCTGYSRADGASCEQCFDAAGRVIYDSCGPDCRDVVCPMVACTPGYLPQRFPGECCDQCVPADNCEGVVCPMASPVPDCPPGSALVRDPTDCCGYTCQPTQCPGTGGLGCATDRGCAAGSVCIAGACLLVCNTNSDCPPPAACVSGVCESSADGTGVSTDPAPPVESCAASTDCAPGAACYNGTCQALCTTSADCPAPSVCMNGVCLTDGNVQCPPGYTWREDFPFCGQCVPMNDVRYCMADGECNADEICAFDAGVCNAGPAPGPNSGSSDPTTPVAPPCYGVCRPANPDCTTTNGDSTRPTVAYCEGELVVQPDANGCPYPVCICPDGTVSLDGTCRNQCDTVQCFTAPPTCEAGYHVDFTYPYCCGVCVPDDICAYMQNGGTDYGVAACPAVACAPGYRMDVGPDCCPICVRDACTSDGDCLTGEHCTTDDGVCNSAPGCDPTTGCLGPPVCYGECVPNQVRCTDSDYGIDIFTPGVVTFADDAGGAVTVADKCSDDGLSVIEAYCYRTAAGERVETVAIKCPAVGCVASSARGAACYQ